MSRKKLIFFIIGLVLFVGIAGGVYLYQSLFAPCTTNAQTSYLYIDRDDNVDSVYVKLKEVGQIKQMTGYNLLTKYQHFGDNLHTGCYEITHGKRMIDLYRQLSRGQQSPVRLTVPSTRTVGQLIKTLDRQLMIDSTEISKQLFENDFYKSIGFNELTIPAFFIPNTYEVYWNLSAESLLKRLKQEYDRYWNEQRRQKAQVQGLTPQQVAVLASIVDEETAKNDEKPIVAGLYLNRLHRGMLLQADPTVKFALNDPTIKRILFSHLEVDSPYNTYKYEGLPPGPIRVASLQALESVLNPTRHNYLYMCAKEDFSGYHNFAVTNAQHAANARRYQQALNQRGIK